MRRLKELGLEVLMLTGDNQRTQRRWATPSASTASSPASHRVRRRRRSAACRGRAARGHGRRRHQRRPGSHPGRLGIALGTGTDIAHRGDDSPWSAAAAAVVTASCLSRPTFRMVKQNLFWAFGYNAALIPLAAGVGVPRLRGSC